MTEMGWRIQRLPQAHGRFHVDEAGVLAELPVRVVGDPPLPVVGVHHFPSRKRKYFSLLSCLFSFTWTNSAHSAAMLWCILGEFSVMKVSQRGCVSAVYLRTYPCLCCLCLLEEAWLRFDVALLSPPPPGSLQIFYSLLLWRRHFQVSFFQVSAWARCHFSAVGKHAKGNQSRTFDRVWTGCLCGAAHLSAQGRVRSAQWQTWWSHSRAHSLWAWSLETTEKGHRVRELLAFVGVCGIMGAHLASTRIWQKVGHRSKDPRAISQTAGGSLYLLDPSQTLGPHSHSNSSSFPGRKKVHKGWWAEHLIHRWRPLSLVSYLDKG